ncbi:hypothetical protein STEG23_005047 [Scotinomys teguina]
MKAESGDATPLSREQDVKEHRTDVPNEEQGLMKAETEALRYMYVSMNVCHVECSTCGSQNRASDSLELEFIDNHE